jgi:hypothetical protein
VTINLRPRRSFIQPIVEACVICEERASTHTELRAEDEFSSARLHRVCDECGRGEAR